MATVSEVVEFRRDLFFDGAVQINWFESDTARRDKAASNFVFHGPEYHGVAVEDLVESQGYNLIDTVTFTASVVESLAGAVKRESPISLAIAGYGTGKSHLALTLATLLSDPKGESGRQILENLKRTDPVLGSKISIVLNECSAPILVLPINGMGNFDLASELSRQALGRLHDRGLDTSAIDDLWPRFQQASSFVERNFTLRKNDFIKYFGNDTSESEIINRLSLHEDIAFQYVNEVFLQANGYPLRAIGEESPTQLIETLCEHYCGEGKHFHGLLIIFDEFGRYLEFAADRPHIAGDAALQQIYEGVQNNSDKCSMLCLNQYELKVYLSRISRDSQSVIQRYIGRYDSAKKYHLSSNLETLFAHLIQKKDTGFLDKFLQGKSSENQALQRDIQAWFPVSEQQSVWKNSALFQQVIVRGCWPLHPLATWFLCRSSEFLQQRSALSFVADAFDQEKDRILGKGDKSWSISATKLCDSPLVKELIATEESGLGGAAAQSYELVTQKYQHDFSTEDRQVLLAVLIASKLGLKVGNIEEAHRALSALSGFIQEKVENVIGNLVSEYGVLEWNDRFHRYEIIGDAIPRSTFLNFLRKKTQSIAIGQIESIFSTHCKVWADLADIEPIFAAEHSISTPEWQFVTSCSNLDILSGSIENALVDWRNAIKPDELRGQLIYCYGRGDENNEAASRSIQQILDTTLGKKENAVAPIIVVFLHDEHNTLSKILAEYSILCGDLPIDERHKFSHFIEDHKSKLKEELKRICEELTKNRCYFFSSFFKISNNRLVKVCNDVFQQAYPDIIPFDFDGFRTTKGNAAKDCRLITVELLTGSLNHSWLSTQTRQTQNRASQLLESWDVMGGDGQISMRPKLRKLSQLIGLLDDQLEQEKILNIGKLFKKLLAPPYGFNIASAGLVFGVFLSPRQNIAVLVYEGQDVTPATWIRQAFSGSFLNLKILDQTRIRYVSDSETGEWQKLLSQWDMELTHLGKLSYLERAQQLRKRIPLPHGELYERYTRLEEHAERSINALRALDNFWEKQAERFDWSYKKKDAGTLCWIAQDVQQRLLLMKNEVDFWTEEQSQPFKELFSKAREAAVNCFDDWLPYQSCLSSAQIPEFRIRLIDKICRFFRNISLHEYAEKTEKHALHIISQISERQKISYIVNESKAFIDSHQNRISQQSRVAELRIWIKEADNLVKPLIQAGEEINAPEIRTMLNGLEVFKEKCKGQIKKHEDRFGELWNLSFQNFPEIKNGQREVNLLLTIFSEDNPANIDDLTSMQRQLSQFEEDCSVWSNLQCSNEVLIDTVESRINTLLTEQDDEDEAPWDHEDTYRNILENFLEERQRLADRWLVENAINNDSINEMDARSCRVNLAQIGNPPLCLSPDQIKIVERSRYQLTQRLGELQLDGVIEMYRSLSAELQREFIKIINTDLST
ncbi:hypothetical protein [uncultured Desulfobulbus sp.]|uniref:hypothetical protein n=1 Tax=uncultured Desulfobulbus sp. TaxID=239745 RepID=UPI0029C7C6A1|nr:hypothetical protein [uncultured Desulfobulbus sp.]